MQEEKEMATITVHVKTPKEKKSISVGDKSSVKDVSKNSRQTLFTFSQRPENTFHFDEFFVFVTFDLCQLLYVNTVCLTCHNIHNDHCSSKPKSHPSLTTHPWNSFA